MLSRASNKIEALKKDPALLESLYAQVFLSKKPIQVLWAYGQALQGLAQWAQQAIAESLGKRTKAGKRVGVFPVVLKGPEDQHSVLQLLTEGPQHQSFWFFIPESMKIHVDRKLPADLAQFEKLGLEDALDVLGEATFKTFEERLKNDETLQPLARFDLATNLEDVSETVALIQAFVEYSANRLQINAFDQPGVERGKQLAREIMKARA